jgi:hypothetical protein
MYATLVTVPALFGNYYRERNNGFDLAILQENNSPAENNR